MTDGTGGATTDGTGGAMTDGTGGATVTGTGGAMMIGTGGAVMTGTGGAVTDAAATDVRDAAAPDGADAADTDARDAVATDTRDAPATDGSDGGVDRSAGTGGAGAGGGGGAGATDGGGLGSGGAGGAATLKAAAAVTGRLIGAAIGAPHLSETAFTTTAAAELSYLTPENEMKWDATEPTRGQFTFAAADSIVSFASQNGIQVKGHNLVWYQQLPAWVTALTDPADIQLAMTNHITQLVNHFHGKVVAWDVVNEAWNDDGGSIRSSVFFNAMGAAYVDIAFQAARAADASVHLYYNDYSAEGLSAKANAVYTMVQSMIARGIPIDGVGLQMHVGPSDANPSQADLATNMHRLVALGLEVVISEMDVGICTSDLATQETRYHDVVAACVAEPGCKAVTVWGVPDKYSWLNGRDCTTPQPLLFDNNYARKPAYTGVFDAFLGL